MSKNINIYQTNIEKTEKVNQRELSDNKKTIHPSNSYLFQGRNNWHMDDWGTNFLYPNSSFNYNLSNSIRTNNLQKKNRGDKEFVVGISYLTTNQYGLWFTYGKKTFFIMEYSTFFINDQSEFYDDLTMDKVISWDDEKLQDIKRGGNLSVGVGIISKSFGVYISPTYGWVENRYQFFDEFFILSNNGKYSLKDYSNNFLTIRIGGIYKYKSLSTKVELDLLQQNMGIGLGITL